MLDTAGLMLISVDSLALSTSASAIGLQPHLQLTFFSIVNFFKQDWFSDELSEWLTNNSIILQDVKPVEEAAKEESVDAKPEAAVEAEKDTEMAAPEADTAVVEAPVVRLRGCDLDSTLLCHVLCRVFTRK